jgi:uncharacterized protein (TIGR03437 family)
MSASTFAPDEAVSLYYVTGLNGDKSAELPLSTTLDGVSVMITDSSGAVRAAAIYGAFASNGQINLVIPGDTAPGAALAAVKLADGSRLTAVLMITMTAPGIFTANMNGRGVYAGQVVHAHPDGSQSFENPAVLDPGSNTYSTKPIDLGPAGDQVFLVLYGTGIRHASSVTASINGVSVAAVYAAQSQYAGLDQVNLQLPRTLAGAGLVNVVVTVNGQASNTVTVAVQ